MFFHVLNLDVDAQRYQTLWHMLVKLMIRPWLKPIW